MKVKILFLVISLFCQFSSASLKEAYSSYQHADLRDKKEIVFIAFGDSGTGSEFQLAVADAMMRVCQFEKCDFALMLGDNIYSSGVSDIDDKKFMTHFEQPYQPFGRFDFWTTLGNHDWRGNSLAQIAYTLRSDRWRLPYYHYKVPLLPDWLHIYSLDTQRITKRAMQLDSAKIELCGKYGWRFLFGHHPIYSNGKHGPQRNMIRNTLPVVKSCKVQFLLSGHDHHQEHIQEGSFHQIIQGAAAKLRAVKKRSACVNSHEQVNVFKHIDDEDDSIMDIRGPSPGTQLFAESRLGFSIFRINPGKINLKFYGVDAKSLDGSHKLLYEWSSSFFE